MNTFENNNFVYFTRPKTITTYLNNDGEEKKKLPFKDFSWKDINEDNYKNYVNSDDKSFYVITGKMSNITVLDFDDAFVYDELVSKLPDLKKCYTVKTNRGYHIYFKYNELLPTTTNINKLENIDCRNDGGIVIAPPTKYKLLNGEKVKYEYLGGTIEEIPAKLLKQLLPKKKKEKQEFVNEIKHNEIIKLLDLLTTDRSDNYDDWVRVGIIICNELREDGRTIYNEFSKLSDKYDEDECNKKYDSFKNDKENKLTIATLKMMAKEDNAEEYAKLYKIDDSIKATFTMLEKDIAEYIISKLLNNNFICHQLKPA